MSNGANNQNRRKPNAPPNGGKKASVICQRQQHKNSPPNGGAENTKRNRRRGNIPAAAVLLVQSPACHFFLGGQGKRNARAVIALASPFARMSSPLRFPCLPLSQRGRCQAPLPPDGGGFYFFFPPIHRAALPPATFPPVCIRGEAGVLAVIPRRKGARPCHPEQPAKEHVPVIPSSLPRSMSLSSRAACQGACPSSRALRKISIQISSLCHPERSRGISMEQSSLCHPERSRGI